MLAREESCLLGHNHVGTEHLLLGLLREEEVLAFLVLDTLDITVEEVRAQVARVVSQGDEDEVTTGQIPFTPRTKKVLELALREALSLGQDYIGTEHILLGLVRENDGIAARILVDFDADAEKIRNEIIRILSDSGDPPNGRRRITIGYDQSAQLLVACPNCDANRDHHDRPAEHQIQRLSRGRSHLPRMRNAVADLLHSLLGKTATTDSAAGIADLHHRL